MINAIIQYCIDNKLMVVVGVGLVAVWGMLSMKETPLDAIPDLSENQVIVLTNWQGRAPQVIEDQITYPLSAALQGIPGVKALRASSAFGFSMIYVIFEDSIDPYWARSRVLEKLNYAQSLLPAGVVPQLGPDGTGVGHVFWYTLKSDRHDLAELRAMQDFYVRYLLQSVQGVAEVASIGGFEWQYQVDIDPNALRAYDLPLMRVLNAIRQSNIDVGGRILEMTDAEYFVQGSGYIESVEDIEDIVVRTSAEGTPVTVGDVAAVQLGGDIRRGLLDENGEGEVVGGIVVMRYEENAHAVIARVRERLTEIEAGLPEGVVVEVAYDRSDLIEAAIHTLTETLTEEAIVVSILVIVFLTHLGSALVVIFTLPLAVLIAFIFMRNVGVSSNIMSLGGIAIAIGVLVDASIVMVENAFRQLAEAQERGELSWERPSLGKRLIGLLEFAAWAGAFVFGVYFFLDSFEGVAESDGFATGRYAGAIAAVASLIRGMLLLMRWSDDSPQEKKRREIVARAARQVGPAIFFSMLIIITSFVPVFMLTGQEGKLFSPLAWTKTFAMLGASVLSITFVPFLMSYALRGRMRPEHKNPVARVCIWIYTPFLMAALRYRKTAIVVIMLAGAGVIPLFTGFEWDLNDDGEPEIAIDAIGSEFMPALDEGSLLYMPVTLPNVSVNEAKRLLQLTDQIIADFPEVEYVLGKVGRADTATDPAPVAMLETIILLRPREEWRPGMTKNRLISELDAALQIPGLSNGWTMPIINRINMLATGIRTDLGVKFFGEDLEVLADLAVRAEEILRDIPGAADLYAERVVGGRYIDISINREAITRYGLAVNDVQMIIETAIGGMPLTQTVEGRDRFDVRARYSRDFRDSPEDLGDILVSAGHGLHIPLGQLATIEVLDGPPMINSEDGLLRSVVLLNVRGRDMGSFMAEAQAALEDNLETPAGYTYRWSGQWENQMRAKARLKLLIPIAIFVIFMLLYITFKRVQEALLVMLAVPFALVGGMYLLFFMEVNFSVAVWVGFIALFGVAVETGVVMVIYLQEALDKRIERGDLSPDSILKACVEGSVLRLRPKLMTAGTTLIGLTPILWATGTGSDVMRPIAIPMVGGMVTSVVVVLILTPVLFAMMKIRELRRKGTLEPSGMEH